MREQLGRGGAEQVQLVAGRDLAQPRQLGRRRRARRGTIGRRADLVVGMHADGATRIIVEYAAQHRLPFAVVPCCSDNSMPYKPWMRHLDELAHGLGLRTEEALLPMRGRARTLLGWPVV